MSKDKGTWQCLFYALDEWHEKGGYLMLGKSVHWGIPHVMHSMVPPEELTHYVPPGDLKHPWYSLFGFHGTVKVRDTDYRGPMSLTGVLLGAALLLILSGAWVVRYQAVRVVRCWRRLGTQSKR